MSKIQLSAFMAVVLAGAAIRAQSVSNWDTPQLTRIGTDVGPENPSAVIEINIRLNMHNEAFQVQIDRFALNGEMYRANTSDPTIEAPVRALVSSVGGMDDLEFEPAYAAISAPGQRPSVEASASAGDASMFSARWAIANEEAGVPLGQASRYLYSMPAGTITDVLPHESATNVTEALEEFSSATVIYGAAELAAPLENTTTFYSAIWKWPLEPITQVVVFGTDTSLTTTPGWDDVTGLGTPNPKAFADYFNRAKQ